MIIASGLPSEQFVEWRNSARKMILDGVSPAQAGWASTSQLALGFESTAPVKKVESLKVPPAFIDLAQAVSLHRDERKWELLYRVFWRLIHENKNLLEIEVDPDVNELLHMRKAVYRDAHKMHAFVRFKEAVTEEGKILYIAWHRPDHLIVERESGFFMRRFGDRDWSILTSDLSAHWHDGKMSFTAGVPQHEFHLKDDLDLLWKSYYKSIFNPARIKVKAMKAELPVRHWQTLPEAELIPELIRSAPSRLQTMAKKQNLRADAPQTSDWSELKSAALSCQTCPFAQKATQTVFGEGNLKASVMIVGEQPGDQEDLQGRAFAGPAGEVFDRALLEAGIEREKLYVTNAVKHFKWTPISGKRRLHQKPSGADVHACRPWLERELAIVKPNLILALGQTAALTLLGRTSKIGQDRKEMFRLTENGPQIRVSWHPSAILRAGDERASAQRFSELVEDLRYAQAYLTKSSELALNL